MATPSTFETRVSPSLTAYGKNTAALADSRIRLTTGQRIVRNGDDAASLSTATKLQAQTSTLRSSLQNDAKATSFLQIAYDGLDQIRQILSSLAEFADTATQSGTTTRQLSTLDAQFQSAMTQIDTVVANTTFGGAAILDGSASGSGAPVIVTGDDSADRVSLTLPDVTQASLFGGAAPTVGTVPTATSAVTSVSNARQTVAEAIAKVDAYQLQLATAEAATSQRIYGVDTAIDQLLNTDMPEETRKAEQQELTQNIAATVIAQTMGLNSGLLELLGGS